MSNVKKGKFEKGYTQTFSSEVFTICEVKKTNPTSYKLCDDENKMIKGIFYDTELVSAGGTSLPKGPVTFTS